MYTVRLSEKHASQITIGKHPPCEISETDRRSFALDLLQNDRRVMSKAAAALDKVIVRSIRAVAPFAGILCHCQTSGAAQIALRRRSRPCRSGR